MMERTVFEELYPKIYNYVYYRVLNRADAEDIVSDVFLKAVRSGQSFDAHRTSYATWLFTIAHNCVVNFYRGRKNTVSLDALSQTVAQEPGMDEALIVDEETRRLRALLKELPERERTVLALRFWGEFSYKEIAGQTGLSISNVGVIINRTVEKLGVLW